MPLVPRTRHASSEAYAAPNFAATPQTARVFSPAAPVGFATTLGQGYPFYPPAVLQTWAPSTQTVAFDLSSVINLNGLSPQMAYKPIVSSQPAQLPPHQPHRMPFSANVRTQRSSNSSKNFTRSPASGTLPLVNQLPVAAEPVDMANMGNGSVDGKGASRPLLVSASISSHVPVSSAAPSATSPLFPAPVFSQNRPFPDSPADATVSRKRNEFVPMRGASDAAVAATAVVSTNGPNSGAHTNRSAKSKSRNKRRDNESAASASSAASETRPKVNVKAPSFDLEAAAFPPLPGATSQPAQAAIAVVTPPTDRATDATDTNGCLADVVKGLSRSWKESCSMNDVTDGRDRHSDPTTSQSVGVVAAADAQPVLEPVLKPAASQHEADHGQDAGCSANPSDSETDADAAAASPVCGCSSAKTLSYCDVARKAKQQPKPETCCNSVPAATCSTPAHAATTNTANSK